MPEPTRRSQRILVTGGAGFIGSNVAEGLLAAGHHVLVVDRVVPPAGLAHAFVDVRDRQQMAAAFDAFQPDVVFHFAAQADGRRVSADPVAGIETNVLGTAVALEAASRSGVRRFILASSIFVYAAATEPASDEETPFLAEGAGHVHTTNFIAREWLVRDYGARRGLPFTILRMAPVYGPRMWPGLAVGAFVEAARRGGPIVVFGDGEDRRAFLHVDDLTSACIAVLADKAQDRVYNVLGPETIAVNTLAAQVAAHFPGVAIEHRDEPSRRGELSCERRDLSGARILRELGWVPHIGVEVGIQSLMKRPDERLSIGMTGPGV